MEKPRDGYVPFRSYKTYYKVFGSSTSTKPPLLVLHGGPGSSHNYLLGLAKMASERQIFFYDQIGGGLSDRPSDNHIWSFNLFLDELRAVRDHLGLNEIHLLGQSWGGMLAIEYLLSRPAGVRSVVLASSMVSMPLYREEVDKLKQDLPALTYETLLKHEFAGTTDSEAYSKAMQVYNGRHIYRGETYPPTLKPPSGYFCKASYEKLWGVSEAYPNGQLRNWNRLPRLHEIQMPVLITSGQYDELTPHQAVVTHDAIPGSQLRIFTAASHFAHVEQPQLYVQTVRDFLNSADKH